MVVGGGVVKGDDPPSLREKHSERTKRGPTLSPRNNLGVHKARPLLGEGL